MTNLPTEASWNLTRAPRHLKAPSRLDPASVMRDSTDDHVLLGPVDLKSQFLGAAPHALFVTSDEITLTELQGRSRLWIVVLPAVLIAWTLQPHLPDPLPPTLTYILLVLAAFYIGDRWSNHATQQSFHTVTPEQAAKNPDHRINRDDLVNARRDSSLLGDSQLILETSTGTWSIEIPTEDWSTIEPVLDEHGPAAS